MQNSYKYKHKQGTALYGPDPSFSFTGFKFYFILLVSPQPDNTKPLCRKG